MAQTPTKTPPKKPMKTLDEALAELHQYDRAPPPAPKPPPTMADNYKTLGKGMARGFKRMFGGDDDEKPPAKKR